MNILGLISQLIGIKTLRLIESIIINFISKSHWFKLKEKSERIYKIIIMDICCF